MNNQRKIKFRVWDSKARFMWMEDGPGLNNRCDKGNFGSYPEVLFLALKDLRGENGGNSYPNPGNYTLQQFIGILDKNSKEIYEGDIVTVNLSYSKEKITGVVEFSQETLNYVLKFTFEGEIYWEDLCMYRDFEVIGNIYKNFDML